MNKALVLCFCLLSIIAYTAHAKPFNTVMLSSAQLPPNIKYEGKFKSAIRWTDKLGDNIVVLAETGIYVNPKFKHEIDGSDAELFAYHYLMKNTPLQTWKIYDFIQDCDNDLVANFVPNMLQVTDLNSDGIGEVWVMYKTTCRGDVSPCDMKVVMYQGQEKFAMRGHNKVLISEKQFEGGDYKFDKAFNDGPDEFRAFALKLWNKNLIEKWGE